MQVSFSVKYGLVSQNHRMSEVGRHLWILSSPSPLHKAGSVEQAAKHLAQLVFKYLQEWRLQILSAQPVPVLEHTHSNNIFFLYINYL